MNTTRGTTSTSNMIPQCIASDTDTGVSTVLPPPVVATNSLSCTTGSTGTCSNMVRSPCDDFISEEKKDDVVVEVSDVTITKTTTINDAKISNHNTYGDNDTIISFVSIIQEEKTYTHRQVEMAKVKEISNIEEDDEKDVETGTTGSRMATGTNEKHKEDQFDDIVVAVNDDGNCLPSIAEIHHSNQHHHHQGKPSNTNRTLFYRWKVTIIFLTIFIVLLLSTIAIVSNNHSSSSLINDTHDEGDKKRDNGTPIASPPSIRFTPNYNRTMEYLLRQNVSTYESLSTYGTPQYYATYYIANTLQMSIPIYPFAPTTGVSVQQQNLVNNKKQAYRYIARYVLALNYFYFNHFNNNTDTTYRSEFPNWMNFVTSNMDICQWNLQTTTTPNDEDDINRTIQMGVTCSMATKLPINLTINNMNLHGTLPTEIGLLTSLQVLNLESNSINGLIPTELCTLTNLRYLNLGHNDFRHSIPSCIGDTLRNVRSIYIHGNNLDDPIPTSMMKLQALKHFVVSDNLLSGDPIPIWNQLSTLEVLMADRNRFLSPIDETFLQNHTSLRWMDLSDNDFELAMNHPFPRRLLQMPTLEVLDFSRNRLEGTLPSGLQSNTMLQYLSLYGNFLDGSLHELTNLRQMRHLDVSENDFTGTIQSEFGRLTNLRLLFLGDNDFDIGTIPTSFANLTQLEDLSIRNCKLNGTFDVSFLPKSLIYLDLGNNTLTGSVSEEIGYFSKLEFLMLNGNTGIGGALPTAITQLTSLRATFLDGTSLTAGMDQICTLPKFRTADSTGYDVVAYADCGHSGDDTDIEMECDCCRCCADSIDNNGTGCSMSYQMNLRQDWSEDFQTLKFTISNDTVFINRDYILQ